MALEEEFETEIPDAEAEKITTGKLSQTSVLRSCKRLLAYDPLPLRVPMISYS